MAAFVRVDRLQRAIINLSDWRGRVRAQTASHILPLLALLEKRASAGNAIVFEEADDFSFFDHYSKAGGDPEKPYFDPFIRQFRIHTHPHSNIATARKGTFSRSWHAAEYEEQGGRTLWTLSANYPEIIRERVLSKGTDVARIPVVDLSVWLFRDEAFPDDATTDTLIERFKERFHLGQDAFDMMFVYEPENADVVFTDAQPTREAVNEAIGSLAVSTGEAALTTPRVEEPSAPYHQQLLIDADDPVLGEVTALISLGTSGVILRGPPGTGKSWYAEQLALSLTGGASDRIFRVQFHPTYTYEDFFDGYVPSEETKSGFKIEGKIFRKAIERAAETTQPVVFVIDEINRGDTARIFGETLTYIEHGWRGERFSPRFGESTAVPRNLFVLATMNPHDRSITQLDMALLRRFDHIDIPPNPELLRQFVETAGMGQARAALVVEWFRELQRLLPFGLGHTFFIGVGDEGKLSLVWRYRILPFCQSILEFEQDRLADVARSFEALTGRLRAAAAS
jgi:5-methylcytosine-specific restriction enzyme B